MLKQSLIAEFKNESALTKKIIERVPEQSFGWKPHEKSMTLGRLATHISELLSFVTLALTTDELDFATRNYKPATAENHQQLMDLFNKNYDSALQHLEEATDAALLKKWVLRNGDRILVDQPAGVVITNLSIKHIVHHRGQLSVYLRLLNVPLPSIYGPSADEAF